MIFAVLVIFSFTACEEELTPSVTIKWDTQGGSEMADTEVKVGDTIAAPTTAPTLKGYTFSKWTLNADGTGDLATIDLATIISGEITLYAQWTADTDNYVLIKDATELAAFRDEANRTTGDAARSYDGKTVLLIADITLSGEWAPIGKAVRGEEKIDGVTRATVTGTPFEGIFDGNNKKISGLTITVGTATDGIGLFGCITGDETVIKNLTVEGSITNTTNENAGLIAGLVFDGAIIDNCTTTDQSSVTTKRGNGGIAGRILASGAIKNSTNNAAISGTGGANVGGIVGGVYFDKASEDSIFGVYNSTNNGTVTGQSNVVGGIVGLAAGGATIDGCTNTANVSGKGYGFGGIVGEANCGAIINDCDNTGNVTVTNAGVGVAGLVGWIRYNATSYYPNTLTTEVTNSTNEGDVTSDYSDVGSALGLVYYAAIVENVVVSGTVTATGGTQHGGFIGGIQTTDTKANYKEARNNVVSFKDCDSTGVTFDSTSSVKGEFIGHVTAAYTTVTFEGCLPGPGADAGYIQLSYPANPIPTT